MPLDLYLLRHGETVASQTGGYCGALDLPLTPAGEAMAAAFAEHYQSLPWQAVFVSPLQRAVATARPLCQAIGLAMQERSGLREIQYGEWEGQTADQVKTHFAEDYLRWLTEPAWNPPTGGETSVQIASRAALVLAEIEQTYTTGNVLVVSHKATLRIMLCSLLGIDLGRYRDRLELPVASLSLVRFDVHGPLLVKHGDRSHLPAELANRQGT